MKCKRILSALFSVMMVCSFLGCFPSGEFESKLTLVAEAAGYNPAAAIEYAEKHWNNYNKNYSNYNSIGGDCANFVSQCLYEGGLEMTDGWYWKSYSNRSSSWSHCVYFYNYFNDLGYEIIENPSASEIDEGNPILYAWDGVTWGHAAICIGKNSSGVPIVAAHNNDYKGTDWKMGAAKVCTIIIPSTQKNTLTMNYNTNGGTIAENDTYYAVSGGNIYRKSDSKVFSVKWGYDYVAEKGLYDAATFKLSRPGYTFLGWSTSKSDGTVYSQTDNTIRAETLFPNIYTKSGKVTLYAQWKKNILTMNYNTNGGTIAENDTYYAVSGGNIYRKSDSKVFSVKWGYDYVAEKGLYDAATFKLSRPGYTFLGWSTSKSDGTVYSQTDNTIRAETLFPNIYTKSGKVTLYAQWKKNILTMNYNTNGGTIAENDTYYAVNGGNIYRKSDSKIFSVKWGYDYVAEKGLYNAATFKLSRPGYTFLGWSTSKSGGTVYSQTDNTIRAKILFPNIYTKSGTVTLYAQWKANKYTVTLNANGGSCNTKSKSVTYNSTYGDLPKPSRTGYTFKGWFTAKSGGKQITKDSKVTITADQTLYAQWQKIEVPGDVNADGTFGVTDIVLLQKWVLGSSDTKLTDSKKADMNNDGRVDAFDLCIMKHELIKK